MLRIGGSETLAVSLLPPPLSLSPSRPPRRAFPDTTDNLSLITHDDNDTMKRFSTTLSIFHSPASDQMRSPPWMAETQTAYIIGPIIYMHFLATNTSDAGFNVDLLFRHPDYLKASICFIIFDSATYKLTALACYCGWRFCMSWLQLILEL